MALRQSTCCKHGPDRDTLPAPTPLSPHTLPPYTARSRELAFPPEPPPCRLSLFQCMLCLMPIHAVLLPTGQAQCLDQTHKISLCQKSPSASAVLCLLSLAECVLACSECIFDKILMLGCSLSQHADAECSSMTATDAGSAAVETAACPPKAASRCRHKQDRPR